jgi:hypothetical protein
MGGFGMGGFGKKSRSDELNMHDTEIVRAGISRRLRAGEFVTVPGVFKSLGYNTNEDLMRELHARDGSRINQGVEKTS